MINFIILVVKQRWMINKIKRFKFEYKITALMLLVLIVVLATGTAAYFRYSFLLNNINQSMQPDAQLNKIQMIRNELAELSNIAKTHSLTGDDVYYEAFSFKREKIMKELASSDSKKNAEHILLDTLITNRLIVLDGIMFAEDPYRVQTALWKVLKNIENYDNTSTNNQLKIMQLELKKNNESLEQINFEYLTENKKRLEEIKQEELKLQQKLERANKRNNGKKSKALDSLIQLKRKEAKILERNLSKEVNKNAHLSIEKIYSGIENVSQEELTIENEIKSNQLKLISMDNLLNARISAIVDNLELKERNKLAKATHYATSESKKTAAVVGVFSAFVAVLIFLISYFIKSYVQKNRQYEKALRLSASEKQRLISTRERLVSSISHEIRTPMHAIAGFAEQLSKHNLRTDQQEFVTLIQKSSKHLTYLVNDILDLSKLNNDKLKLNYYPFCFNGLVNEITDYTSSLQLGKDVKVNIEIDPQSSNFYMGDEYRLRQILINLVGNAIKYTEVGSVTLKVNVVKSENSKDTLQFIVQDTGVGMSKDALDKAFSEFEQFSEVRTSNEVGTGLGLAITKKIVELFNGSILINSELGKGTTVQVEIVLERTFKPQKKMTEVNNIPCSSVLIVDDEVYNRKLVNAMLSPFLLEINEVENGKEALDILLSKPIDLILLDAKMPVMDGLETIRAIRNLEDKQKSKVKVILLTAADNEISDIIDKVDGFLPKPFNEEQLIDEIVRIFDTDKKEKSQMVNNVVDFSNLKSLSGSDKNFYIDMLQTFVVSTTNSQQVIKAAFAKNDWELLANEAHKIASPCRHIGANNLHKILKEIEQSARNSQQTFHLKETIKALNKEIELVLDAINTEISTLS